MSDSQQHSTLITRVASKRDAGSQPSMSYTAVTTHPEMAAAFAARLMDVATRLVPDHPLTLEDIIAICQVAQNSRADGNVPVLEGRHLRGRISDQLSRAKRYREPFSMLVLKLVEDVSQPGYEATIDTLSERMRQTDMLFSFKKRIVLLLPHTEEAASLTLVERLKSLIKGTLDISPIAEIAHLAFPCSEITKASQVLNWAEDQLR